MRSATKALLTVATLSIAGLVVACHDDATPTSPAMRELRQVKRITTGTSILQASFTSSADGFSYLDDAFRGTARATYASGGHVVTGGFSGGGLRVQLGGVDNSVISGMSGGWTTILNLVASAAVSVTLRYNLSQSPNYESDENSQVLLSIDGTLKGTGANDYLARIVGNGNGGSNVTTGWVLVTVDLGVLSAGSHVLTLGAYNSKKTLSDESTALTIDDVAVTATDLSGDQYMYADDAFRGTNQPTYASGSVLGDGRVRVNLGGINDNAIGAMSGGWRRTFTLATAAGVTATVRYSLTQSPDYESDEVSQVLLSVDGVLRGAGVGDYVAQLVGNGNGGGNITTGVVTTQVDLGVPGAGSHVLTVGAYNNKKSTATEWTEVIIEDVALGESLPVNSADVVAQLDFQRFMDNIQTLAAFGDRTQGAASNLSANDWIEQQFASYGYTVERHAYTYNGLARNQVYATKVGSRYPDRMYIVSAHMDGRGGGGGADDDASGTSLVLEAARALGQPNVTTDYSVRFILWNNEETGLNGSAAYVSSRASLQGIESPAGSGKYPEPRWLGVIQHDMILFDHGLPVQPQQIAGADVDVEYQASSTFAAASQALAQRLRGGNLAYSTDYPAQVGSNMSNTDSHSFRNHTAAVSVRENQRIAEIGNGSNPNWHKATDVFSTYSLADFRLGFNAVQMTTGTVAELAGARITVP